MHPGQGTQNRKFHFGRFFFEILWLLNESELSNHEVIRSGLTRRALRHGPMVSPFGICVVNTPSADGLFAGAHPYQPAYFPMGQTIDVLDDSAMPYLPWIFRLPFREEAMINPAPSPHPNGATVMTSIRLSCAGPLTTGLTAPFLDHSIVAFDEGISNGLIIEFDRHAQGRSERIDALSTTLRF